MVNAISIPWSGCSAGSVCFPRELDEDAATSGIVFSASWHRVISGFAACALFEPEQPAEIKGRVRMVIIATCFIYQSNRVHDLVTKLDCQKSVILQAGWRAGQGTPRRSRPKNVIDFTQYLVRCNRHKAVVMRASVHLVGSFELEARAARQVVSNPGGVIPQRPPAGDVPEPQK